MKALVLKVLVGAVVVGGAYDGLSGHSDALPIVGSAPAPASAPAAPPPAGTVYSYDQLSAALRATGMSADSANVGAAIAEAESGGRSDAVHLCPPRCDPGQAPEQSYGPWQINLLAHRGVSAACAMALACAASAAAAISSGGRNWAPWSTYGSRAYLRYLR